LLCSCAPVCPTVPCAWPTIRGSTSSWQGLSTDRREPLSSGDAARHREAAADPASHPCTGRPRLRSRGLVRRERTGSVVCVGHPACGPCPCCSLADPPVGGCLREDRVVYPGC
jgi:hypothetical protein